MKTLFDQLIKQHTRMSQLMAEAEFIITNNNYNVLRFTQMFGTVYIENSSGLLTVCELLREAVKTHRDNSETFDYDSVMFVPTLTSYISFDDDIVIHNIIWENFCVCSNVLNAFYDLLYVPISDTENPHLVWSDLDFMLPYYTEMMKRLKSL